MKAIQIYEATDGARFDSVEKCRDHEHLLVALSEAMLPIGQRPVIGHGRYIQRDRESCMQAKRNLLGIVRRTLNVDSWPVFKNSDDEIHPCSIVGRIIDDCGPEALRRAWNRLMCINWENFREYDQPYFASHPDEAKPQDISN